MFYTANVLKRFNLVSGTTVATAGLMVAAILVLARLITYLKDPKGLRSYPGPFLAKFSHLWLYRAASGGTIIPIVHAEHQKHGTFVRIAPDHISIANADAIQAIYGHNTENGHGVLLKSESFYSGVDLFGGVTTLFSVRSHQDHTRKRKIVAHSFSTKSVLQYEPVVRNYNRILMQHWDRICASATKGLGGQLGDCQWEARDGWASFDCLPWFHYQVFDIIGDLVFDSPFGMTSSATDKVQVSKSQKAVINAYGVEDAELEYESISAVKDFTERSKMMFLRCNVPPSWRPLLAWLPWLQKRRRAAEAIANLSATAVMRRLKGPVSRDDNILSRLLEARDENGQPMGNKELSAEALTLLVGGTDTTSNSSAIITFYLAHHQDVQRKLQRELDDALGPPSADSLEEHDFTNGSWDDLKNLTYLQDVMNEGLRFFSTIGIGLPRVVPEGGMTILGETFEAGTVVSVPSYTIHRDKAIWGPDADEYNPDRWSRGDRSAMQRAFVPFSTGSRTCIGRNLALMEMTLFMGNLFHRYQVCPAEGHEKLSITDGLLRKPASCVVSVKRRAR